MHEKRRRSGKEGFGWQDIALILVITALLRSGVAAGAPREELTLKGYDNPPPTPSVYTSTHTYYGETPLPQSSILPHMPFVEK